MRQNEQGFTLLEILAAIVILGFFSLAAGTFFTQSAMFANSVEEEVDRTNLNQAILYQVVERENTLALSQSCDLLPESNSFFDFLESDENGRFVEGNNERLYPSVTKCVPANVGRTIVTVGFYNQQNRLVSEMHELITR
ncbi:type II secretion system protein [Paenalkalicoccus suaedae]|uniref:Type II secretion system protein n=1 Tax=Paenalkalicoccus suaedae TaxID=2592382 RepID=A0A859FI77_9BACI|nr:type II secretion system protein [Paenalkalicoccus suaedae]QKS72394.1 type II secretion system protein [Paenalkalicoccus suaedae]